MQTATKVRIQDAQRCIKRGSDGMKGPLLSYIAPCAGDCSTANKGSLLWTKIQEDGFQSGAWISDKMIQNGMKTEVTIPSTLKAGKVSTTPAETVRSASQLC
jgi:hypothetical protein